MKQERPVLDIEGHRKVRALGDGGLELAVSDEAPRAAL